MEYNCNLCEEQGIYFATDDGKKMKIHNATKHLHLYTCLMTLICSKTFTTEKGVTNHYQQVHRKEYKHNKNKIDAEIKNMGKLINKELAAEKEEAEAARLAKQAAEEEAYV